MASFFKNCFPGTKRIILFISIALLPVTWCNCFAYEIFQSETTIDVDIRLPEPMTPATDPDEIERLENNVKYADEDLIQDPNNCMIWLWKGADLEQLGKYEEAIACYDKIIEIEPDNSRAWNAKGGLFIFMTKYEQALSCLDEIIKLEPESEEYSWIIKGYLFEKLGQNEEAEKYYAKGVNIEGVSVWEYKIFMAASHGKNEEVMEYMEKAIAEAPTKWKLWKLQGDLLQRLGRTEEADACYKKAEGLKKKTILIQ